MDSSSPMDSAQSGSAAEFTGPPSLNTQPQPTHPQGADRGPQVNQPVGAATGNHGNTQPPMSIPAPGLITDPQRFSQMYPKHSYRDAFNNVLSDMKNSIVGSVDELCRNAISEKLMTHAEKAGILVDDNGHKQASRFLDSLAPKIEVEPVVLALLMNMLSGLHLRTCDHIVCVLTDQLKGKQDQHEIDGKTRPLKSDGDTGTGLTEEQHAQVPSSYSTLSKSLAKPKKGLSEIIKKDLSHVLETLRKEIVASHSAYLRCIRICVEETVKVKELCSFLLSMEAFESDSGIQQKLLSGVRAELEAETTTHGILDVVTKECASFLNVGIFECIVNEYDIDHGQEALKYSEHLEAYVKKHKISEFAAINPKLKSKSYSKELILKFDVDTMCKLTRVTDLQKAVARILKLLPSAIMLYNINDGCVLITFLLPKLVAEKIFTKSKRFSLLEEKEFCSLSVLWLSCGSRKFIFKDLDDSDTLSALLDLKTVCDKLGSVEHKSHKIGVMLGIPQHKLLEFQKGDNPLPAIADFWLRGNVEGAEVSWKAIATAIASDFVGEPALAKEIRQNFCQVEESQKDSCSDLSSLDPDVLKDLKYQLELNLNEIIQRYNSYVQYIRESIIKQGVTARNMRTFLMGLSAFSHSEQQYTLLCDSKLDEAIEIDDVFVLLLKNYASFLNYKIFKILQEKYVVNEGQEELQYPELLKAYLNKLKISEFLEVKPSLAKPNSATQKITLKLDIKLTSRLSRLENLQKGIAQILEISPAGLQILDVEPGSIIVAFLVQNSIANVLFTKEKNEVFTQAQIEAFRSLNVLWLRYKDYEWNFSEAEQSNTSDAPQSSTKPQDTVSPPSMNVLQSSTEPLDPDIEFQLHENLKKIKQKYASFVFCLCQCVNESGVTTEDLCTFLSNMSPFDNDRDLEVKLQAAGTVNKIFDLVSKEGASFFHYDIFQSVLDEFCTSDAENPKLTYSKHFREYVDRHGISEFFEINPKLRTEYSGDLEELAFKFNVPVIEKVGKIVDLRYEFIRIFGLKYSAVQLVCTGVEKGSVIVTFLIPRAIVETVCTPSSNQIEELRSLSVLWLKCGDKEIINFSDEVDAEESHEQRERDSDEKSQAATTSDDLLTVDTRVNQNSKEEALLQASKEGHTDDVDALLKQGADISAQDEEGNPPLHLAAVGGHESVVSSLLEVSKVNIDYQTKDMLWSALFHAYANGHNGVVKLLLEYGANEDLRDKDGRCAADVAQKKIVRSKAKKIIHMGSNLIRRPLQKKLSSLCVSGEYESVRHLLEEAGNTDIVNARDSGFFFNGWPPILWACEEGRYEIVDLLLQKKADIQMASKNGWTALHIACANNFVRIVYLLLRNGADPDKVIDEKLTFTPLMYIIDLMENMEPMARALLKYRANLEIVTVVNGWTPLIQACHFVKKELVELFLDHYGASHNACADQVAKYINKSAEKGWTALMAAARSRRGETDEVRAQRGEIVKLLLDRGANMEMEMSDAKTLTGERAIHIASYTGNTRAVELLIEHGANLHATSKEGFSPLMIATKRKHRDIVKALCKGGAEANQTHKETGLTPLFYHVTSKITNRALDVEIFRTLLEYGADHTKHLRGRIVNIRDMVVVFGRELFLQPLKEHELAIQQGKLKAAGEGGKRSIEKQQWQEQPKIGTEEKEKGSAKPDDMEACDPDMELNPEKPETAHEISIPITVDTTEIPTEQTQDEEHLNKAETIALVNKFDKSWSRNGFENLLVATSSKNR